MSQGKKIKSPRGNIKQSKYGNFKPFILIFHLDHFLLEVTRLWAGQLVVVQTVQSVSAVRSEGGTNTAGTHHLQPAVCTSLICRCCSLIMAGQSLVIRAGVGFLYPAYKSLHAVMNDDREASINWLRYWVVLAVFSVIESLVDPLLDFLPGYLLGKCLFLLWCMMPSKNSGSNLVFTQVVRSYFMENIKIKFCFR